MGDLEYCCGCYAATGRAGRGEDSLYAGELGPYCEECWDELPEKLAEKCAHLEQQLRDYREASVEMTTDPGGDYYLGLHCGIEDRDITDRYDAADFGWQKAFEYIESCAITPPEGTE